MTDELYEATKREVMTEEEEYRNADVPMPKKEELDKDFIEHLEKFFKGKKIIDRDRGTNLATGISLDLSDEGISKPEQRLSASDGESTGRSVSTDDMEYQGGAAYKAILKLFSNQLDDEKFAEHCKKFFKGNNDD